MTSLRPALAATTLSCVVPAFNEGGQIVAFVMALRAALAPQVGTLEIIVVDDGSKDDTAAQMRAAVPEQGARFLRLSRNFGKENALSAGIDAARGDCVLLIDSDFQHPFEAVGPMLAHWAAGIDMVYGLRTDRSGEGLIKRLGTRTFYRVMGSGSEVPIPVNAGDFRLMDRRVVDAIKALPERNRFMKGLYAWVGFSQVAVPFVVQDRAAGQSSFSLSKLLGLALTGMTAFSVRPLRWIAGMGAVVAVLAVTFGTYIVIERLVLGQPIPGFATLAASVTFFSGVQLFCIGVLGEYLGRVYTEVKARPVYIVAEEIDASPLARGLPLLE